MPLSACLRSGVTSSSSSKYSVLNSSAHGGQQNKPPRAFCSYGGWWGGGVWGAARGVGVGVCGGGDTGGEVATERHQGAVLPLLPAPQRPPARCRQAAPAAAQPRQKQAGRRALLPARPLPAPPRGGRAPPGGVAGPGAGGPPRPSPGSCSWSGSGVALP